MAIYSRDGLMAATRQRIHMGKTGARTLVAQGWYSLIDIAGNPGAGTLAGVGANGAVQTDATAGYPPINAFGGGATGYLSGLTYQSSVACRLALFDCLWKGGPYAFNANQAVTMPSIASRVPGGDYKGLELWVETVTVATGNQTWNVTYTDQDGNVGATTGATGIGAAPAVGRCWALPLASGDSGVQAVTNVAGGTGTAGTANILLMRRLATVRVNFAGDGGKLAWDLTEMPEIFADSALVYLICADSTAVGLPTLDLTISNG